MQSPIDENVANNGQPTDNTRVIVGEGNRTPLQAQMAARSGQSRPRKRPIKNFSPVDKVGAIDRVRDGESKASVARDIGAPESTLRGWCKSEHKIRGQINNITTELIPRHSPANIGNVRSMSANGRQSVGSRHSSNSRQSPATQPNEDAPVAKRLKLERTGRQNSPQTVMTVPSTSLAGSYLNRGNTIHNYAALLAEAQRSMYGMIPGLNNIIPPNNSVGLVENGLQYTRANNTTFPMVSNSTTTNNSTITINEIDSVRSTMGSIIGNAMRYALDHTIGDSNIAVAPTQGTSSSYTQKSPSVRACTPENALAYLNVLLNNHSDNIASDDSSENRVCSQSISSERSDSREEREDSSVTAATAERGTLTTPPVIEPKLSPEVMEVLRVANMNPSNAGIEQAIKYGTWLQEWLNNCSIPLLSEKRVLEHKYIVDVLKWVKNSQPATEKSEIVPSSCTASTEPHDEGTQL